MEGQALYWLSHRAHPQDLFTPFSFVTSLKGGGGDISGHRTGDNCGETSKSSEAPLVPICSKSSPHRMSCLKSKKNVPSSSNIRQELACKEECLVSLWVFICCLTHVLPNYTSSSSASHSPLKTTAVAWLTNNGRPSLLWPGADFPSASTALSQRISSPKSDQ